MQPSIEVKKPGWRSSSVRSRLFALSQEKYTRKPGRSPKNARFLKASVCFDAVDS
ncbi:hypothetical protein QUB63_16200 [Microcoleus sp. ARI1-B5]|uniref:hypothetical protein n=1 Tax=unclassified Microcoleus TaxID=2642155 RepID=UPI002FD733BB